MKRVSFHLYHKLPVHFFFSEFGKSRFIYDFHSFGFWVSKVQFEHLLHLFPLPIFALLWAQIKTDFLLKNFTGKHLSRHSRKSRCLEGFEWRKGDVLAKAKLQCFYQNMLLNLAWMAQQISLFYPEISHYYVLGTHLAHKRGHMNNSGD